MSSNAQYAATPNNGSVDLSLANTAFDGSGSNISPLWTAGAGGGRVDKIELAGKGSTAAGLINFFRQVGGSGAYHYLGSVAVVAVTVSTTVPPWSALVNFLEIAGLQFNAGDVLAVSQTIAQNTAINAYGGNY